MLVVLHGSGGNGQGILDGIRSLADRYQFMIVAPDSRRAPNGSWTWEVGTQFGEVTEDYRHVMNCIAEVFARSDLSIDRRHILIAGYSGGASSAPYLATNENVFTAFAVLHGGVIAGGLGSRNISGWFSTGDADSIRPFQGLSQAAETMRDAGFSEIALYEFHGGHELIRDELHALVEWWLKE
jgi:poly(3-hydroxybutyrate) depolymerase